MGFISPFRMRARIHIVDVCASLFFSYGASPLTCFSRGQLHMLSFVTTLLNISFNIKKGHGCKIILMQRIYFLHSFLWLCPPYCYHDYILCQILYLYITFTWFMCSSDFLGRKSWPPSGGILYVLKCGGLNGWNCRLRNFCPRPKSMIPNLQSMTKKSCLHLRASHQKVLMQCQHQSWWKGRKERELKILLT